MEPFLASEREVGVVNVERFVERGIATVLEEGNCADFSHAGHWLLG